MPPKKQKEQIMKEKATFTNAEKKAKAFVKDQITKMADRVSGSGSDK